MDTSTVPAPAGVDDRDREAIAQAALDYLEGWFDGNAERMTRALHPELVKRSLTEDGRGLEIIAAEEMIGATARGAGKSRDVGDRRVELHIDDVHGDIASATLRCAVYVDYLQLVRTSDGWRIANVLWARRA